MSQEDSASKAEESPPWENHDDTVLETSCRLDENFFLSINLRPSVDTKNYIFELHRGETPLPCERFRVEARGNKVQLTLQHASRDDAGHYALVAKRLPHDNESERLFSRRVHMSVDEPSFTEEGDPPLFLRRLTDLTVKVGTRTRFLVEIRSNTDPKVTWHRNDEPIQAGPRFSFVHEGNFFCVDVAPVTVEDQGHWTCMAENRSGRSSCTSHLNVLVPKAYKRPEFVSELCALLTETGTVSLECKVIGVPTPVLRWFKDDKEIKAGDVFALTANPNDPTSLGTYTCEAVNCMGTAYSSSRVHVAGRGSREGSLKPADKLIITGDPPIFNKILRDESCKIGESLLLRCQVQVPPWPKDITWYNKEGRIENGDRYKTAEDGLGGYSIYVKPVEAVDEGEWKCVATSAENVKQFTTCYVGMSIPKNYRKPRFMESLKAVLTEEGLVSFECKVVGFPTPLLRWFKDGQELKPGDVYQLTGTNSLGSYCCIAKNCMGEAKSLAELTVEDIQNQLNDEERLQLLTTNQPPKFIRGLRSSEARITENFKFSVQVSVMPEPNLTWFRDDHPVVNEGKYQIERETLGTCHLEVKRLEFCDQAEWKCVASNDFGQSITSCFLKLIIPKHYKKPKFLENLRAILSDEGAVNLECKVIGVPQPVLKWYKDGEELKPGDIHRIISGQDGTCCLGTYTCEATNCMGTVSSSAALLGFEDRVSSTQALGSNQPLISHIDDEQELARNLSLSTIHEERTSQLMDTAQTDHSMTVDDRGEVSFSFDGKEVSVSLYETPDLTEEEALQIVEMYADQLSEHVTEHNIIELPPMRFVKETSTSGNLLMEAVVIDVSPDYFVSAGDEDDLRTEADLEDISMIDGYSMSSQLVTASIDGTKIPSRPPRRRSGSTMEKFQEHPESEAYHSAKEPTANLEKDVDSEEFADALSSAHTKVESIAMDVDESKEQRKRIISGGSSLETNDSSIDSASGIAKKRLKGEKKSKKKRRLEEKGSSEESSAGTLNDEREPILDQEVLPPDDEDEGSRSSTKSNKERMVDLLRKISEPVLVIKEALTDSEIFYEDENLIDMFVHDNIINPIQSLCELIADIETKALSNSGDKSFLQSVRISILETIGGPTEELLRGLELMKRDDSDDYGTINLSILESLVDPVDEILMGLAKLEFELSGRNICESPVILDRTIRTISRFGETLKMIDDTIDPTMATALQKIHQILDDYLNSVTLNQFGGWTENIDAVLVESLARPLEDLERSSQYVIQKRLTKEVLGWEEKMSETVHEVLSRLDALVVALEGYESDYRTNFVINLKTSLVAATEVLPKSNRNRSGTLVGQDLPEIILDPLIDAQTAFNTIFHEVQKITEREETTCFQTSELASSLAGLRDAVSYAVHKTTTLRKEDTVAALINLKEPLIQLKMSLSVDRAPEELLIIESITDPLYSLQRVTETATEFMMTSDEGDETLDSIKSVLGILQELESKIASDIGLMEQNEFIEEPLIGGSLENADGFQKRIRNLQIASELGEVHFELANIVDKFGGSGENLEMSPIYQRIGDLREFVGNAAVAIDQILIAEDVNFTDVVAELSNLKKPLQELRNSLETESITLTDSNSILGLLTPMERLESITVDISSHDHSFEEIMEIVDSIRDTKESIESYMTSFTKDAVEEELNIDPDSYSSLEVQRDDVSDRATLKSVQASEESHRSREGESRSQNSTGSNDITGSPIDPVYDIPVDSPDNLGAKSREMLEKSVIYPKEEFASLISFSLEEIQREISGILEEFEQGSVTTPHPVSRLAGALENLRRTILVVRSNVSQIALEISDVMSESSIAESHESAERISLSLKELLQPILEVREALAQTQEHRPSEVLLLSRLDQPIRAIEFNVLQLALEAHSHTVESDETSSRASLDAMARVLEDIEYQIPIALDEVNSRRESLSILRDISNSLDVIKEKIQEMSQDTVNQSSMDLDIANVLNEPMTEFRDVLNELFHAMSSSENSDDSQRSAILLFKHLIEPLVELQSSLSVVRNSRRTSIAETELLDRKRNVVLRGIEGVRLGIEQMRIEVKNREDSNSLEKMIISTVNDLDVALASAQNQVSKANYVREDSCLESLKQRITDPLQELHVEIALLKQQMNEITIQYMQEPLEVLSKQIGLAQTQFLQVTDQHLDEEAIIEGFLYPAQRLLQSLESMKCDENILNHSHTINNLRGFGACASNFGSVLASLGESLSVESFDDKASMIETLHAVSVSFDKIKDRINEVSYAFKDDPQPLKILSDEVESCGMQSLPDEFAVSCKSYNERGDREFDENIPTVLTTVETIVDEFIEVSKRETESVTTLQLANEEIIRANEPEDISVSTELAKIVGELKLDQGSREMVGPIGGDSQLEDEAAIEFSSGIPLESRDSVKAFWSIIHEPLNSLQQSVVTILQNFSDDNACSSLEMDNFQDLVIQTRLEGLRSAIAAMQQIVSDGPEHITPSSWEEVCLPSLQNLAVSLEGLGEHLPSLALQNVMCGENIEETEDINDTATIARALKTLITPLQDLKERLGSIVQHQISVDSHVNEEMQIVASRDHDAVEKTAGFDLKRKNDDQSQAQYRQNALQEEVGEPEEGMSSSLHEKKGEREGRMVQREDGMQDLREERADPLSDQERESAGDVSKDIQGDEARIMRKGERGLDNLRCKGEEYEKSEEAADLRGISECNLNTQSDDLDGELESRGSGYLMQQQATTGDVGELEGRRADEQPQRVEAACEEQEANAGLCNVEDKQLEEVMLHGEERGGRKQVEMEAMTCDEHEAVLAAGAVDTSLQDGGGRIDEGRATQFREDGEEKMRDEEARAAREMEEEQMEEERDRLERDRREQEDERIGGEQRRKEEADSLEKERLEGEARQLEEEPTRLRKEEADRLQEAEDKKIREEEAREVEELEEAQMEEGRDRLEEERKEQEAKRIEEEQCGEEEADRLEKERLEEEARMLEIEQTRLKKEEADRLQEADDKKRRDEEARKVKELEEARMKEETDRLERESREQEVKQIEEEQRREEEADRLEKERLEEEARMLEKEQTRLKKEEADRLQEAEDKKRREEEARKVKELEEAQMKEEKDRLEKEREEQEAKQIEEEQRRKEENDRLEKERLEEEARMLKEEQTRLKKEEADRLQEAEDKKRREEEARKVKELEEAQMKEERDRLEKERKNQEAKQIEEEQRRKEEADRLEKERLEEEARMLEKEQSRLKKEEADRLQEAGDKKRRDEEARKVKELEEAQMKEERDRLERERREQEVKQIEEEQRRKEEADRLEKERLEEEARRLEKEQTRLKKEEADRLQEAEDKKRREEEARKVKELEEAQMKEERDRSEKERKEQEAKQIEEEQRRKEKADRLEKERLEEEARMLEEEQTRLKKEEADRLQEAEDKKRREKEARKVKELEEAQMKEERDRLEKERKEQEAKQIEEEQRRKEEADRLEKERLEEEARMLEEEQTRLKKEEADRLQEAEDKKRREEEARKVKELEEAQMKEERCRLEEERKEQEAKRIEEEQCRKEEADRLEKKRLEEEARMLEEEQTRLKKEEADRLQEAEDKKRRDEEARNVKEQEEAQMKEERDRLERERREQEVKQIEEEQRRKEEADRLEKERLEEEARMLEKDQTRLKKDEADRLQEAEDKKRREEEARKVKELEEAQMKEERDRLEKERKEQEAKQIEEEQRRKEEADRLEKERLEEEARMLEEEQTRLKKEAADRLQEAEDEKRRDEEARKVKELEEMQMKEERDLLEEERKEQEAKRIEEEQCRKEEADRLEKKRLEEEARMLEEEQTRLKKEGEDRLRKDEERRKTEDEAEELRKKKEVQMTEERDCLERKRTEHGKKGMDEEPHSTKHEAVGLEQQQLKDEARNSEEENVGLKRDEDVRSQKDEKRCRIEAHAETLSEERKERVGEKTDYSESSSINIASEQMSPLISSIQSPRQIIEFVAKPLDELHNAILEILHPCDESIRIESLKSGQSNTLGIINLLHDLEFAITSVQTVRDANLDYNGTHSAPVLKELIITLENLGRVLAPGVGEDLESSIPDTSQIDFSGMSNILKPLIRPMTQLRDSLGFLLNDDSLRENIPSQSDTASRNRREKRGLSEIDQVIDDRKSNDIELMESYEEQTSVQNKKGNVNKNTEKRRSTNSDESSQLFASIITTDGLESKTINSAHYTDSLHGITNGNTRVENLQSDHKSGDSTDKICMMPSTERNHRVKTPITHPNQRLVEQSSKGNSDECEPINNHSFKESDDDLTSKESRLRRPLLVDPIHKVAKCRSYRESASPLESTSRKDHSWIQSREGDAYVSRSREDLSRRHHEGSFYTPFLTKGMSVPDITSLNRSTSFDRRRRYDPSSGSSFNLGMDSRKLLYDGLYSGSRPTSNFSLLSHKSFHTSDHSLSVSNSLSLKRSRRRFESRNAAAIYEGVIDVEHSPKVRWANKGKPPTFCTRLMNCTVAEGSHIRLMCTTLGQPEPQVYWTKNGDRIRCSGHERMKCENGVATLEISSAGLEDSGYYSCVAQNAHGQCSTEATVRVYSVYESPLRGSSLAPHATGKFRMNDKESSLENLICGRSTSSSLLSNNERNSFETRYGQSLIGDISRSLRGSESDLLKYNHSSRRVTNKCDSDWVRHMVHFDDLSGAEIQKYRSRRRDYVRDDRTKYFGKDREKLPKISSSLTDYKVPAGGTIALQVQIKDATTPKVTWLRERGERAEPLSSSKVRTFAESGIHTLILPEATESEAGTYVCRVSNDHGYIDTIATVEVIPLSKFDDLGKPAMFVSRPADTLMTVMDGEAVSVSFRISGTPRPRVIWMKGVRDITDGPRSHKEMLDDYVRLTLNRVNPEDEGTYCILVKNCYGCDRSFFTIKVRQRARSLTPTAERMSLSDRLSDIHLREQQSHRINVPGPIKSEPIVVDGGRNWLSLSWGKSDQRGPAPVIAYRVDAWQMGGDGGARWVELGISPINSFDAFNLRPGGEYKFRVTPRNRYGWGESVTMSKTATVCDDVELPEFSKILAGQIKALVGSTVTLECEVRSESKFDITWLRETTAINPDENTRYNIKNERSKCSLILRSVSEDDSGRYVCEATNKAGKVSSYARVLVVRDPKVLNADARLKKRFFDGLTEDGPPQFTMRLRDRRVQASYPVRLTCQVFGVPEPEVTWYKDDKEVIQTSTRSVYIDESHFHTLEIAVSNLDDAGCYMACAKNVNGSVSCSCILVVDKGIRAYIAPEFLYGLDVAYAVKMGGELRLTAQIEAYPSVGIVWHRDGIRLRPSRRAAMSLSHDGTVELFLAKITSRDAGVYTCTATNEVGRAETTARVSVISSDSAVSDADVTEDSSPHVVVNPPDVDIPYSRVPLFVTKPLSTEAQEGDTVIIQCEVVGDPKPEVMWLRDFLKPDYYRDAAQFRRIGAGPQYCLEIPHAKLDYTGTYSVLAKNEHGEAKAIISLQIYARGQGKSDSMDRNRVKQGKVLSVPIIKSELKDIRCCDGDAVTFKCKVFAPSESPNIRWEKSGRPLHLDGDFSAEFDGETAKLIIRHVYPEDEGEYTCVATNELGKAFTSACLVVDVPEGKENTLSQPKLTRPQGLLSTNSTPRSTPRSTPVRSLSPGVSRGRELKSLNLPRRLDPSSARRKPKVCPPKFYTIPHNRVAEEGETVRFQCAVAGHPQPWCTWDKDGQPVTSSARISIKEKDDLRILEISEVSPEDAGLYRVTLENDVGRTEATARLEIINRNTLVPRTVRTRSASPRTYPTFNRSLLSTSTRLNGRLQLQCDIRGSPKPSTTWFRNGSRIEHSARIKRSFVGGRAILTISEVKFSDSGEYVCEAKNLLGTTRSSCKVVVLDVDDPSTKDRDPPKFLQSLPTESIVMEGHSYELQTRLKGSPPYVISWFKDGHEILDSDYYRHIVYEDGGVALRFLNVHPLDAGDYTCLVKNEFGEARCRGLFVVQDYKSASSNSMLSFLKTPVPVFVEKGETACFCARIQSERSVEIDWTINGKSAREDYRYKVERDGSTSILRIPYASYLDCGEIRCTASISRGPSISSSAQLRLRPSFPAASKLRASLLRLLEPCKSRSLPKLKGCSRQKLNGLCSTPNLMRVSSERLGNQNRQQRASSSTSRLSPKKRESSMEHIDKRKRHLRTPPKPLEIRIEPVEKVHVSIRPVEVVRVPIDTRGFDEIDESICELLVEERILSVPKMVASPIRESIRERIVTIKRISSIKNLRDCAEDVDREKRDESRERNNNNNAESGVWQKESLVRAKRSVGVEVERKGLMSDEGFEVRKKEVPALVIRQPDDVVTLRGATVTLEAIYQGSPEPSVKWMRAGRELVADRRIKIDSRAGVSRLTLHKVTADQAGKYAVAVENALGSDCRFASVAVEGPPEAPVDPPVVLSCPRRTNPKLGKEDCGCLVTWCSPPYDGGCALSGYTVEQRRCGESTWRIVAENCHSLSRELPSSFLQPGHSYVFRVRAVNAHGPGEPSPESRPFRLALIVDMGDAEDKLKYEERQASMESENGDYDSLDKIVVPEEGQLFKERYILHEELGKGRYGVVRRVVEKKSAKSYAAKFVRTIKSSDRQQVQEEIKIMNMLRHPKLLRLAAAFESPKEIVMVTEYISGGELFERVVADDFTLTEKDSILFMRQICEGVRYMHENNVVHLDLKPENIMCHTRTSHRIKLIDFGLAQILNPSTPVRVLFGTPEFIPPEIINYEPIGTESDMWSVGVICYVLLTGLSPFMGDNDAETFANIVRADYDFEDEAFDAISPDAKDFISNLLQKKKELRMSAKQCLSHSWLAQHTENMSRVALPTDKLKKFIVRRKWQKTGNALRALGRMAMLSANRRSPSISSTSSHSLSESTRSNSLDSEHLDDGLRIGSSFERSISHESKSENGEEAPVFPGHRVIDDILEEEVEGSSKERASGEPEKDVCEEALIDNNANSVGIVRAIEVIVDEGNSDGDDDNGNLGRSEVAFGRSLGGISSVKEPIGSLGVGSRRAKEEANSDGVDATVSDLEADYTTGSKNSNSSGIISSKFGEISGVKYGIQSSQTVQKNDVRFAIDEPGSEKSTNNGRVGNRGSSQKEIEKSSCSSTSKGESQGFERDSTRRSFHRSNPPLGATSIEESRLEGSSTNRGKYTLTGNVSRTARLFEKLDTEQGSDIQQSSCQGSSGTVKDPSPSSPSSSLAASVKARSERIQRAFAFWNK